MLVRPTSARQVAGYTNGKAVLVTAAHVLNEMEGDYAVLVLRVQINGQWIRQLARLPIRRNGQPLWMKNPTADVAVMYVRWPLPVRIVLPTTMLAGDEMLQKDEVVPGVELKILGYPLGATSNDAGFPILRTGVIASYPLLPTASTQTFLLDFRVFKGNSGGPVYFAQPVVKGGSTVACCPPQFIMGLVSREKSLTMPYAELQLSIGEIIHASVIKATIESLPAPETSESKALMVPVELLPNQ
jgi:hypothetical protein